MKLKQTFFQNNRRSLRNLIDIGRDEIVIVAGAIKMQFHSDQEAEFLQESNFYYLTGISEPGCMLVIDYDHEYLVIPEANDFERLWNGQLRDDSAKKLGGFDNVLASKNAWERLSKTLKGKKTAYILEPPQEMLFGNVFANPARRILKNRLESDFAYLKIKTINQALSALRVIKQPEEIDSIKSAIDITATAFQNISNMLAPGTSENEVHASIINDFVRANSVEAYKSIVAGGERACTIHYIDNNQKLEKGDLLLIDAGARVTGYAADITRTLTIGNSSKRQLQVIDAVKSVHDFAIKLIKPGLKFIDYEKQVVAEMGRQLKSLSLIDDDSDISSIRKYYPHATSHFLGLDVHDVGFHKDLAFAEDMILTVEPGIYIPEEKIGVRLEDNIIVTNGGIENLSASIPL